MIVSSCPSCGTRYSYPLSECTFCHVALKEERTTSGVVVAVTEISVPSIGHEDVPYWCALVERPGGGCAVVKRDMPVAVGDVLEFGDTTTAARYTVGVLGSGVMARGLVELLLSRDQQVVWVGRSAIRLTAAREKVAGRLARVMDEEQLTRAMNRLAVGEDAHDLASCDLVIEAIIEDADAKIEQLKAVEPLLRESCVIASNTSSLPLDVLSAALDRPERFGGMHFFNPPSRMRLVEVIRAPETTDETDEFLFDFSIALGKTPIRVANGPGFVVNRVLMPLLNEAVRELEDGAASAADIDEAIRLGLNHPMGPLALADLIGLDVVARIMDDMHSRLQDEAYAPRPLLRQLVREGKLGRKSGEGFFSYTPPPAP